MIPSKKKSSWLRKKDVQRKPVVYQLQARTRDLLAPLVVRGLTITVLVTPVLRRPLTWCITDPINSAMTLGGKRQLWTLKTASIWGSQVGPDIQLVFLGVINKILDYLVTDAIEHIAWSSLTIWMTRQPSGIGSAGVQSMDFGMKEEMVKPWIAITNFFKRCHLLGWPSPCGTSGPSCLRFLTLITSVCFLLQGAAINTIGLPKARWYPDLWPHSKGNEALMTMSTPRMNLTSIDWTDYRYTGLNTVRSGPDSEDLIALASASTYVTLNLLDSIYQNQPGWSSVIENSTYVTAINTNISTSRVQSHFVSRVGYH